MQGRIVEISSDHRYLFLSRGFMVIRESDQERSTIGKVPLDDISAVIANSHGISYSNNLLVSLAERGIPFVLCASNHSPVAMLWPLEGHNMQSGRMDAQLEMSKPTRKRLWAEIVKAKIGRQANVLEATGAPSTPLKALVKKVRSGDPDNIEAQGARRYWTLLFGKAFRRNRDGGGINTLLNYGYMVLRAATARSVIAAGLHPAIGLHHSNQSNNMRLVDDLMEPFRPLVDLVVWDLKREGFTTLTPEVKRTIVHCLHDDLRSERGLTPPDRLPPPAGHLPGPDPHGGKRAPSSPRAGTTGRPLPAPA